MPMSEDEVIDVVDLWEMDPAADTVAEAEVLLSSMAIGDPGRSYVLQVVADHHAMRGEYELALRTLDDAEADAGDELDVVQAVRITTLLTAGRASEAQPLLDALRKRGPAVSFEARERVAERLEELGRLREAMRWFTIGLRELDPHFDDPDYDEEQSLIGRRRVRQTLGLPTDAYDTLAAEVLDERRRRRAE